MKLKFITFKINKLTFTYESDKKQNELRKKTIHDNLDKYLQSLSSNKLDNSVKNKLHGIIDKSFEEIPITQSESKVIKVEEPKVDNNLKKEEGLNKYNFHLI